MTFGTLSTGTQAKFSPQLLTSRGRPTKFTLERLQQIRNLVERGESREQIAEILDVTVGSLQVTCSRLGISLRRPKVDNGVRLLRQLNSISRKKTITMHDPIDHNGSALSQPTEQQSHQNSQSGPAEPAPAAKPQQDRLQTLEAGSPSVAIRFQYKGTERTTELPLNLDMIGRLAWEAEFRNMSTAELIGELIMGMMGMVKKDLLPEVLGKP
jgi:Helix-turn-helix domain of resolvase